MAILRKVLFVVGSSNQSLDDFPSTTRFAISLGLRFGNVRCSEDRYGRLPRLHTLLGLIGVGAANVRC